MTVPSDPSTPSRGKDLANFQTLWHSGLASHFQAGGSRYSETTYDPLKAFLPSHLAAWITHVARYWFQKKHPFVTYPADGDRGIHRIDDRVTMSFVGDWGTGTDEAQKVADCVQQFGPDFTVHLGDVYFVGGEREIQENFLGEATSPYLPVKWPMGRLGSFALSGNHEMYARGNGYFKTVLPKMGLKEPDAEWGSGQEAGFFCLQNEYWRVIGIDTGYNSTGFDWGRMPILKRSKWLRKAISFKPTCAIPEPLLSWLRETIKPDDDNRGIILLTHHGCYSAFSEWYQIPAIQLNQIIHRPAIWFWGHEHKLAIYDRFRVKNGIEAHGRCIGHGGMPVERGSEPDLPCPLLAWDNRRYENDEKIDVGFNGHANLSFDGPEVSMEYVDLDGRVLISERWRVDLSSGQLEGASLEKVLQDPDLHLEER
jgi:hypothetical protein